MMKLKFLLMEFEDLFVLIFKPYSEILLEGNRAIIIILSFCSNLGRK